MSIIFQLLGPQPQPPSGSLVGANRRRPASGSEQIAAAARRLRLSIKPTDWRPTPGPGSISTLSNLLSLSNCAPAPRDAHSCNWPTARVTIRVGESIRNASESVSSEAVKESIERIDSQRSSSSMGHETSTLGSGPAGGSSEFGVARELLKLAADGASAPSDLWRVRPLGTRLVSLVNLLSTQTRSSNRSSVDLLSWLARRAIL